MNKKKQITPKSETRSQRLKRYAKEAYDNSLVRLPYTNCLVKKKDFKKAIDLRAAYSKLIVRVLDQENKMKVKIRVNKEAIPVIKKDGSTTRKIPFATKINGYKVEPMDDSDWVITICHTSQSLSIRSSKTDIYYELVFSDIVNEIVKKEDAVNGTRKQNTGILQLSA